MEKALAAFLLSLLETATWIWGEGWWSRDTEATVAWLITIAMPIVVWLMPSRSQA